jgi:hypothetical protein
MKERLIHILDQSVCLSRKQMRDYLSGTMQREEMHAAEIHLNTCPLCSMAMEGFEEHSDEALAAIASLNSGFLKEHFDNIAPQIHLNSIAPAAALPAAHPARKHGTIQPLWRKASIAAAALLAFGVLWYMEFGRNKDAASAPLAMADHPQTKPDIQHPARMSDAQPQMKVAQQPAAAAATLMKEESPPKAPATDKTEAGKADASQLASSKANGKGVPDNVTHGVIAGRPMGAATPPARAVSQRDEVSSAAPEKMVAANTAPAPLTRREQQINNDALASGGQAKYSIAPAMVKSKSSAATKQANDAINTDHSPMELGDESFEKGKYSAALAHYKQQMNTGDSRKRYQATIKAARCYATLGNKVKAEQLLQSVVNEGAGPERRAARRVLRDLE